MNKVFLIGNLAKDPEISQTPNGIDLCKMTLAVNRKFGDKECDFFQVQAWRALGENCAKYLEKGKKIAVSGRIQIRTYDKDGEKRYVTEIIAEDVEFLSQNQSNEGRTTAGMKPVENDDDLPF